MTGGYAFESTPEDAWDAGDSIEEMVRNIRLRFLLLHRVGGQDLPDELEDMLAAITDRVLVELKRRHLSDIDRVRGELILEDIETVRAKLGEGGDG